ncbi:Murein DD-endopeptidase MepM [termite gut metagenome]|uniref:Murein DD-endopeptidase MepM n=1 Tax=termite gut metagenome TaxID=433724 RepID=A0A5J4T1H4_9ZZZZ
MKHYILILSLIFSLSLYSQDATKAAFVPPFDFPLMLSANFGELRTNHLHSGLDIKTQGISGKKLFSIGNGYISRILITHGSGHMLYIRYDNGYTAIYRHLAGFVSPIAERAAEYQQEKETWEVVITPDSTEYPVHAGQHIAWSGNTGYSFGPHLHLDLFETETEDYVNALSFFKNKIKDTRPPVIHSIMLFPQLGKGVVKGSQKRLIFTPKNAQPIEAWGVIGVGIKAYDYMDETNNRYGVHTVTLSVDGKKVFHSVVDRFSVNESRMIYSWTYNSYMKSFIEPGNKLRMLQAYNDQRGLITIDDERDYKFDYELKDLYGNTSHYHFIVRGTPQSIQPIPYNEKYYLKWDEVNHINEPGLEMHIPKEALYDNVLLNHNVWTDSPGAIAFTYQLNDERIPLQTNSDLYIGVRNKVSTIDTTKYYVARIEKDKATSLGGKYENGFVKTRVRELGTFTVKIDTVPPLITAVNPQRWRTTGNIVFKVEEKETDIHSYKGMIDGKYVPFSWEITTNRIIYKVDPHKIKKGIKHAIELVATDECENERKVNLTVTL